MKVCETCKYKVTPPPELVPLYTEMRKYFPKVFYCGLLQVIKCYNPQSPAQIFDCELFEQEQK